MATDGNSSVCLFFPTSICLVSILLAHIFDNYIKIKKQVKNKTRWIFEERKNMNIKYILFGYLFGTHVVILYMCLSTSATISL